MFKYFLKQKNNAPKAKPHFKLGTVLSIPFPALLGESHLKLSPHLPSAIRAEPGLLRSPLFASLCGNSPLDSKVLLIAQRLIKR